MAWEIVAGRSPEDIKKYKLNGTILLGKHYVKMGDTMSLSNDIYIDVANPHIVLVSGKRGSGKSYTLGVFAEGMANLPEEISSNISCLIFDTLGIFWTMKYPNYRDDKLLSEWKLKPEKSDPVIFVPFGLFNDYQEKGIPVDVSFGLKPKEITADMWCKIFGIELTSKEGVLIESSLEDLEGKQIDIDDLINAIRNNKDFEEDIKKIIVNRFAATKKWGLFKKDGTNITDLFKGGVTSILDLSAYSQIENGQKVKDMVIAIISKKILEQRMAARKAEEIKLISEGGFLLKGRAIAETEEKAPLVWVIIDEAHEFLPKGGGTLSTRPLVQLLREGRQPGISMILATQQPGKIHSDVMTQADITITHRVTDNIDVEALNQISSTYIAKDIQYHIDQLPPEKGTALLIDDKLEKIYPIRVRPRFSWHGGEDPTAIRGELTEFGLSFSFT